MTRVRRSRTKGSAKDQQKSQKTKRYGRDVDQVIKDMADGGRSRRAIEGYKADIDDLSGGGAFPCVACDRHFVSEDAKVGHLKSKVHKRRMKQIDEGGWDPKDAELAAGRATDNGKGRQPAPAQQEMAVDA